MKKALITGITGQDGSYLSKFLLSYDDLPEYTGHLLKSNHEYSKQEKV